MSTSERLPFEPERRFHSLESLINAYPDFNAPNPYDAPVPARVRITSGPHAGKLGTLARTQADAAGYYHITLDDGSCDQWGGFWYYLPGEFERA